MKRLLLSLLCITVSLVGFSQSTPSVIDIVALNSIPYIQVGGGERTVRIYLPNGYEDSDEHFPVLYLLDGQNVFSPGGLFGSWDVDQLMDEFQTKGKRSCIVVGIDNSEHRMSEYNPLGAELGKGANETTLPFLLHRVKPYIDLTYRTLPNREHTGIGGSSLGGLTAMFALLNSSSTFSRALIFSPSYWYNHPAFFDSFLAGWSRNEGERFRIYQTGGTQEGAKMTEYMEEVYEVLTQEKGLTTDEIMNRPSTTMKHNEASWKMAFSEAFEWLWAVE